jgi:hypothetical protein
MRNALKTIVSIALASALTVSALNVSTASAHSLPIGGSHAGSFQGGGFHGGGFHGGGFHGGGGALAILGLAGLAAGALMDASSNANDCVAYRNVYDAYGNYLGQRAVSAC